MKSESPYGETRQKIVEIIRAHPGIPSRDISKLLDLPQFTLSQHTCYLRDKKNLIYNEGKSHSSYLWYPVTPESEARIPYIFEARAILAELKRVSPAQREKRLAHILQRIHEEKS